MAGRSKQSANVRSATEAPSPNENKLQFARPPAPPLPLRTDLSAIQRACASMASSNGKSAAAETQAEVKTNTQQAQCEKSAMLERNAAT
jgi:hypothetical protein